MVSLEHQIKVELACSAGLSAGSTGESDFITIYEDESQDSWWRESPVNAIQSGFPPE